MYEIYFAFGLPVWANIRSGRAAVRRCPDRRGRGTGGTEFPGMADLSSGLSEKRWFYKMRLGLARPTDDRSGCGRLSWISPRKEKKC